MAPRVPFLPVVIVLFWSNLVLADTPSVGFLAFGDFGTGDKAQFQVARTMKTYCAHALCQFVLGLGDNFYPSGVTSTTDPKWETHFQKPYGPLGLNFYPVLGNHDYQGNSSAEIEYAKVGKHWQMPANYFDFTKGKIQFFAIDTNHLDDHQLLWLSHELKGSQAKWKIVYGHHPIHSYGYHGNTPELVEKLLPILTQGNVDFYLSGHDHDMQVLKGPSDLVMVVSGAAAQSRPSHKGPETLFNTGGLGFAHFVIEDKQVSLRFIDKAGHELFHRLFSKAS